MSPTLSKSNSPRIQDHLNQLQSQGPYRFLRPQKGKELSELYTGADEELPVAKTLAIRELELKQGDVIPFHVHKEKEKWYGNWGGGSVAVIMEHNGQYMIYDLQNLHCDLVIPAGTRHAVICTRSIAKTTHLRIILCPNDPADIAWQDDVEELLLNKHLV